MKTIVFYWVFGQLDDSQMSRVSPMVKDLRRKNAAGYYAYDFLDPVHPPYFKETKMTPEEAKAQRQLDETIVRAGDALPAMWHRIHRGCISQGFGEQISMELLKYYILSQAANGVHFHSIQSSPSVERNDDG